MSELSLIVLHNISLPPEQFGGDYVDDLFLGRLDSTVHPYFAEIAGMEVSSHILIDRHGKLTQYVAFDQRAWHAGRSSFQGRDNCNDFSVGIELEGSDTQPFDDAQYVQLAACIQSIWLAYPTMARDITGHEDIAPGRKTDPGPFFDWSRLKALLPEARMVRWTHHGWVEEA